MANFFKQMYSDNIFNLEEQFTPKELTAAITVELIARKIKEIERKHTNTGELCSWWNCCDEAKSHIGKEHIWILIVEAFKILKNEEPPTKCRNIFEQTFNSFTTGPRRWGGYRPQLLNSYIFTCG